MSRWNTLAGSAASSTSVSAVLSAGKELPAIRQEVVSTQVSPGPT